jgi:hypothetical protein
MPLEPDDQHHLTVAEGYAGLGMWLDANAELEEIDPEVRHVPEVLAVRLQIYRALEKWDLMAAAARKLAEYEPECLKWMDFWAFAVQRAESIEPADVILLQAFERKSTDAVLQYNLACYECQHGDLEAAKARLKHAIKLDPTLRLTALGDEGLKPIWSSL